MFGYIKLDSKAPRIANSVFKKNYCMLCKSLEKNYGQKSRLLLSFDVTFLLMLFSEKDYLHDIKKVKCFGSSNEVKIKSKDELLKKCAALNLAMAEAELLDHINDDKSFLAKLALKLFKRQFRKVSKEYPSMRNSLVNGYATFALYEKENRSLEEIEDMFSDLIVNIAINEFDLKDEYRIKQLRYVAKWLYFIDACDDLDKDIKTKSFNPLREYGSKQNLFNKNFKFIDGHLNKILDGLVPTITDDINRQITNRIIFCGIPESTFKVMKGA